MKNRIKAMRKKRGLSQLKLSQMIGYKSASRISRIENGTATVPKNKIQDLANALHVSERWLLTGETDQSYTVYTDGGCDVNPGGVGGYGVVIINDNSGEIMELSGAFESTTNNRMELTAAIMALSMIKSGSKVTLHSDSQYLINTMVQDWRKNKNVDLWKQLEDCSRNKQIRWKWVRGHNGNEYNERCDELATRAMKTSLRQKDVGYTGFPEKKKFVSSEGAMGVPIAVKDFPVNTKEEVHKDCLKGIRFFSSGKKKFKDYMKLRTFGIDGWSQKGKNELKDIFRGHWGEASKYLNDEKDVVNCFRWKGRGLSFHDAIRKALVDREVHTMAHRDKA